MKRNFVLGVIAMLTVIITSCGDNENRTQSYCVVEITGSVQDSRGAALVNTVISGRISTNMDKVYSVSTNSSGKYTLKFEVAVGEKIEDFLLSLEVKDNHNKYDSEIRVIQFKAEDFKGANRRDEYYKGTAISNQDFVLKINDLN